MTDSMLQAMNEGEKGGAFLRVADDRQYTGRHVVLDGRQCLNFASTSYLGLELDQRLMTGSAQAARRYGTQFPLPNPFVACPLYPELEQSLERMTGGRVVLAPSTTLAHQAAMGTVVRSQDAILLSKFSHPSQHVATALLRDVPVTLVDPHDLEALEGSIRQLARKHHRIWYMFDGLSSLKGAFAPLEGLTTLQQRHPALHLYVDEAHSTSWTGTHGRGHALERLGDRARSVVFLSLNKAFAAAGSAIVCFDDDLAHRVRRTGGPILYSGAIQPPMLGAAVASARIHLSAQFAELQKAIMQRIEWMLQAAKEHALPLDNWEKTPLFFARCGTSERAQNVFQTLLDRDICATPAIPPLAPPDDSGLRLTLTVSHTREDVELAASTLSAALHQADTG